MSAKPRDSEVIDGVKHIRCCCCKQMKPATTEFFYMQRHYFNSRCRACYSAAIRESSGRREELAPDIIAAQVAFTRSPSRIDAPPSTWLIGVQREAA